MFWAEKGKGAYLNGRRLGVHSLLASNGHLHETIRGMIRE